ncbi:PAS domain S-box-containing protein [Desulfonatronum zhilinae]|nr:PAS domain S-box-containing protein [Desulfonatronum zhilinae]
MDNATTASADADRFRILDHIPLGVLVLDADYRVVFWNKCLAYWTGLGETGITGRDIREFYPLFTEKRFSTRIESVLRGGPPIIFSSHIHKYLIPAKLPDGSHRLQHVTISPMRGPDNVFQAMFMIQDVTEVNTRLIQRKQAEDELRRVLAQLEATNAKLEESRAQAVRMAEQAQEANAAKSIFLANMSHEIRTPMSGILGALDMLSSDERDPEKLTLLRMTTDSAQSLLQIINDILDLSKVEAGKLELRPENVALEPLMERCRHLYSFPAQAKNLELRLEMGPNLPQTSCLDPTRLEQVLRNLLDNAVKFTTQGRITFGVERIDAPDLGPALRFQVRDTGIGIAATTGECLFQPFSQADSSYAKTYGGTGLGLSLCRRLVELMGGTMFFQSTVGQGSTFSFVIPLHDAAFPASEPPSSEPPPLSACDMAQTASPSPTTTAKTADSPDAHPSAHILVAEDVDLNQQYLAFILGQHGYSFDVVSSGVEAVRAFQGRAYDIILMDIQMPEMDGLEATTRIRDLERDRGMPRTPIIALTAYVLPEERKSFLSKGLDGFSPKPIQGDQLHAEIQRLLTARSAETRLFTFSTSPSESPRTPSVPDSEPVPDPCIDSRPVFNLQDVKSRFLGNDKLWQKIVLRFSQEELPEYQEHIIPLLHGPDLQETARLAHKIKGALATLCADPARDAALVVETAAKSGNVLETQNGLHMLLAELKRIPEAPETAKRA